MSNIKKFSIYAELFKIENCYFLNINDLEQLSILPNNLILEELLKVETFLLTCQLTEYTASEVLKFFHFNHC